MARKPDKFERMVEKLSLHTLDETAMTIRIGKAEIAKLLRRQHKAVLKMAGDINCQDMITRLNEYKR